MSYLMVFQRAVRQCSVVVVMLLYSVQQEDHSAVESGLLVIQHNGILPGEWYSTEYYSGQQHYQDFRQLFEHFRIHLQKGVFKFPFPGFVFQNKLFKVAR